MMGKSYKEWSTEIIRGSIDCHDHPFDGKPYYDQEPEILNLTCEKTAETYAILIREGGAIPGWEDWAWWYEIQGPRRNIIKFLQEEYCGGYEEATSMAAYWPVVDGKSW
jgi:hypothetical protein